MAFNNYLEDENDKPYFKLNSLAYYYDKMEGFAEKVEQAAKILNVTKEEVEKNITAYIEQNKNELDQRLAQWDGKLETFDSSVETLLSEWVNNGTMNHIIDTTLIDQKVAPIASDVKRSFSSIGTQLKERKTIFSFIVDDAQSSDLTKIKPRAVSKGIPFGIGVITSRVGTPQYMTYPQIREMENAGCEIMAHTHEHRDSRLLSPEVFEEDVRTNLSILRANGFNPSGFVYPYNSHDNSTIKIVRKYYTHAFSKGPTTAEGANYPTIDNQAIRRIALGSYFDTPVASMPADTTSLDYYKARVDEGFLTKNWTVFVIHSAATDETQLGYLDDTIDYIRSKGGEIVSPSTGFDIYGNIVDIRGVKDFVIDANGEMVKVTDNRVYVDLLNKRSSTAKLTEFTKDAITYSPMTTTFATTENFPEIKGGYLVTYRASSEYYHAKQEYTPTLGTKRVYVRYANADSTFGNWESASPQDAVLITGLNAHTPSDPWINFPQGKIIHTPINGVFAAANGFPNVQGGLLTTYRYSSEYWMGKQEYQVSAELHSSKKEAVWERFVDSALNWTAWRKKGELYFDVSTTDQEIPAHSTVDVTIPSLTGMTFQDIVTISPFGVSSIPSGIMHTLHRTEVDSVTIRFANITPTPISTGVIRWSVAVKPKMR